MAILTPSYFALKLVAMLGCGLMAGVFFAFSTFVMPALARLQPAQGIAAMQSINITVINPLFMGVFLGMAVACLVLTGSALSKWHQPGAAYMLLLTWQLLSMHQQMLKTPYLLDKSAFRLHSLLSPG